jgi:hypothetical protein
MTLSIVTVCMNRREHLLRSAREVSLLGWHGEHLIVDWSSREPLRREELPADGRVRLVRVEGERRWNLCRAYNFGFERAVGERILKLDADAWPTERFDPEAAVLRGGDGERVLCAFGSGCEGRKGQLLIERTLLAAVGGFNERLVGYGFDDKDLQARLRMLVGIEPGVIPEPWLAVIPHSDAERAGHRGAVQGRPLETSLGLAAMRASRLGNRLMAAHHPWGPRSPASRYREEGPGLWQVVKGTVPRPSEETGDEIDHARRMVFWGCFLAIPEVFLSELPEKLVPPSRKGVWRVRWWHKLWWHTGRRLLHLPTWLLSLTRGRLEALRRLTGSP